MPVSGSASLQSDYDVCRRIAEHYENFPVASRLLRPEFRPHLAAIYAFARGADDIADEPDPRIGDRPVATDRKSRIEALDEWESGIEGRIPPSVEPIFNALRTTIETCEIDPQLLHNLITAFRWDVERDGFESWGALRTYADHSAAPIGRLVLAVTGVDSRAVGPGCDDLCVALQYTNFWQDLSVDWPRGRMYLPEDTWVGPQLDRSRLNQSAGGQALGSPPLSESDFMIMTRGLRAAIAHTELLFQSTADLPRRAGKSLELYLKAVWEGGNRILEQVKALDSEVFSRRPQLGPADKLAVLWASRGQLIRRGLLGS